MPDMRVEKDLVAASAVPLLLSILAAGESHGYAILRRVSELSGGEVLWSEGMLYPVLHRLEERGLIRSRWVPSEVGPPRKLYALNHRGQEHLAEARRQWLLLSSTLERAWGGSGA